MARLLRMDYLGAWYHVMNRGIEWRSVFLNDDDCRHFVRLLASMEENLGVEVHVYWLMENHFLLALHTPEAKFFEVEPTNACASLNRFELPLRRGLNPPSPRRRRAGLSE